MKGYTAKVGLRKSRLHFAAISMRKHVRQVPDDDIRWLADVLDQIRRESGGTDVVDMECAAVDPSACATHGQIT